MDFLFFRSQRIFELLKGYEFQAVEINGNSAVLAKSIEIEASFVGGGLSHDSVSLVISFDFAANAGPDAVAMAAGDVADINPGAYFEEPDGEATPESVGGVFKYDDQHHQSFGCWG